MVRVLLSVFPLLACGDLELARLNPHLPLVVLERLEKLNARLTLTNAANESDIACKAGWVDSTGFDCQLYDLSDWCTEGGTAGPGWCQRQGTCHSQGFNWGELSGFADKQGRDASTQCAACGAKGCNEPSSYRRQPEPVTGCTDFRTVAENGGGEWTDSWGYSCTAYAMGQFCKRNADGSYSEGGLWPVADFGLISQYDWFHDDCTEGETCRVAAYEACCSCGGGIRDTVV